MPFIFVKNIKNAHIDFKTAKFISEEVHNELYARCPVEEDDIGNAGELGPCQLDARPGFEHDKGAVVARAEEPAGGHVQVQPVRSHRGDGIGTGHVTGIGRFDDDDLGRLGDIDIEAGGLRIEDRLSGPAGDGDGRDHRSGAQIDDRNREGPRHRRVSDIRGNQQTPAGIVGQTVWLHPHRHLRQGVLAAWREDSNRVLSAIRGEDQILLLGYERPRDTLEARDGVKILAGVTGDDVQLIVRGVRDIEATAARA